jgi:hypothetical protein
LRRWFGLQSRRKDMMAPPRRTKVRMSLPVRIRFMGALVLAKAK